jgi:hypothetical protein
MEILAIVKIIIALATIATGVASLLFPRSVKGFTGLSFEGSRGVAEIRAVLGGTFIGLGIAPLILAVPQTYIMLAITYSAIAVARLISMIVDHSLQSSNLISLAVEIVFAGLLFLS